MTWGWVIMVISSPCTSTNTSPAFRPALCAGVSIPRTFSTWIIFLSQFLDALASLEMVVRVTGWLGREFFKTADYEIFRL